VHIGICGGHSSSVRGTIILIRIIVGVISFVGRRVKGVKIDTVTVGEEKAAVGVGTPSETVDTVADFGWHREFSPVGAM
jgi:hypothetical protein